MKKILIILTFVCCASAFAAKPSIQFNIPKTFPRLILSRDDINQMRKNVESGKEPWSCSWKSLQKRLAACFDDGWKPSVYTGSNSFEFYLAAIKDGDYARDLAIAYHISHEKKYADKAIGIIDAWTFAEKPAGTWFDPEIRYPNTGMEVSRASFAFMYAYDLLRADNLMSKASVAKFEDWMRILLPHIKEGARRWEESGYFNHQYYQNHIAADAMGLLAMGITLNDKELVRYALDSEENTRDVKDVIEGLILMDGQSPYKYEPVDIRTEDGEIMDRYRHFIIGGQYKDYKTKPNRALQYCGLSSIILVACGEMGRSINAGIYGYTAPTGENIKLPLMYYADFYIGKSALIKNGLYAGEDDWINRNIYATYCLWEIAHCRFPEEPKFKEVLDHNSRGSMTLHLFGPVELTHGR